MLPVLASRPVITSHLSRPVDAILVYHQTVQAHWPSRMYLIRTNANLSPKAEPHAIGHSCACVPKYACGVNAGLELFCDFFGGRQDRIGVL